MIEIAGRKIGPDQPPYFIADIGANHDGNLERALMLINLAAEAGADAVKFQNFRAETIVSKRGFEELGQIGHQSAWEKSVYETYEEASIPLDWTPALAERCEEVGVAYMTTSYDLDIADAVDPYVAAHKIGSGDITWLELIRHVASKGKPVLLASGAADETNVECAMFAVCERTEDRDLDRYEAVVMGWIQDVVLMQCNTNYTGSLYNLKHLNLRVLSDWAERYPGAILGLSDHTPGSLSVTAAIALGACVIEKHFTDDKSRGGPDHAFAMTPWDWSMMVRDARLVAEALGDGVKRVEENEGEAAIIQRRALRWNHRLFAGQTAKTVLITPTRPCPKGALEPYRIDEVAGRVLKRDVETDTLVKLEDFK